MVRGSTKDKFRGVMYGILLGDSIWAPFEKSTPGIIKGRLEELGGLRFFEYPNPWYKNDDSTLNKVPQPKIISAGRPTDDSEQAYILATHLSEAFGIDANKLYLSFRKNVIGMVSPFGEWKSVGAGKNTRRALTPNSFRLSLDDPNLGIAPSNGALMRAAPLALSPNYQTDLLKSVLTTHRHPLVLLVVSAYVQIVRDIVLIDSENSINSKFTANAIIYNALSNFNLEHLFYMTPIPKTFPEGAGGVKHSLLVAIQAFMRTDNPRSALEYISNVGGDTDTYGAILGGILGAYHGYLALDELYAFPDGMSQCKKMMLDMADQLFYKTGLSQSSGIVSN